MAKQKVLMVTQTTLAADGFTVRHEVGDTFPLGTVLDPDVVTTVVEVDVDKPEPKSAADRTKAAADASAQAADEAVEVATAAAEARAQPAEATAQSKPAGRAKK